MAELTLEQKRALALARARVRARQQEAPAPAPKKPEETGFLRDLADVGGKLGQAVIDIVKPGQYIAERALPSPLLPLVSGTVLSEAEKFLKGARSEAGLQRTQEQQRKVEEEAKTPGTLARGISSARQFLEGPKRPEAARSALSGIADYISPGRVIGSLLPGTPEEAQREVSTVTSQFGSPIEVAEFFASQIPATAATVLAGGVNRATALAQGLGRTAAAQAGERAAVRTGIALNSTDAGYSAAQDVLAKGGTQEEADRAFVVAAGGAALASNVASKLPGLEQNLFSSKALKPGIIRGAARSAAGEAPQEFLEESGAQIAQNIAKLGTAAETDISEGLLSSGALGAIGGATIGGGAGAIQGFAARGAEQPPAVSPPAAGAEPLRTTTVTYPNREDPTNPITRKLDVLSEPDTDGYITVRDETGKAFEMKAADLEEMEAASPAYQAPPETEAPPPTPTVDRATITERLRIASGTPEGAKPAGRVVSLANDVASALEAEDPVAAQAAIQSRMNALAASRMSETTKAQRQAEIDEAQSIVNDYRVEFARARAAAPARVETRTVEPSSIEQALEQNAALAAEDEVRAAEERAALERESALESASLVGQGSPIRQAQTERQQLFDTIINDATIENPAGAFRQALAERGYPNTELNEAERRQVQARLAFEQAPIVEEEPVAGEPTEVPAPPSAAPPEVVAGAAEPVVEEPGVAAVPLGEEPAPPPTLTQKQVKIARRDFLNGLAASAAASSLPAPAKAKTKPTPVTNSASLTDLLYDGDFMAALRLIATSSPRLINRKIAKMLLSAKGGIGNIEVYVVEEGSLDNAYGMASLNPDRGYMSEVRLDGGKRGTSEETFLHEMIHAFIQQRWRSLSSYLESNKQKISDTADRADVVIQNFQRLWSAAGRAMFKADPDLIGRIENYLAGEGAELSPNEIWALELYRSPDEAISWLMTNEDAKAFLETINMNGDKIKPGEKSWWTAFAEWVLGLFGQKLDSKAELSAFEELLNAGMNVLEAGRVVEGDAVFARKIDERQDREAVTSKMYAGRSIIGPREGENEIDAENRRLIAEDYAVAQQMEQEGQDAATIRVATGWERNPYDNEWRYLQPDNLAQKRLFLEDLIEDFDTAKMSNQDKFIRGGAIELQDLIRHPELYKIYPEAKNIQVFVKKSLPNNNVQGSFNPDKKSITLYTKAVDPLGTLLHEVQHWVQDKEGFAVGGSPEGVWEQLSPAQKADEGMIFIDKMKTELEANKSASDILSFLIDTLEGDLGLFPTEQQIEEAIAPYFFEDPAADDAGIDAAIDAIRKFNVYRETSGIPALPIDATALSLIEGDINSYVSDLQSAIENMSTWDGTDKISPAARMAKKFFAEDADRAFTRYQNLAGEIEARDVSAQKGKTREELRAVGALKSERERKPEDVVVSRRAEGPSASAAPNPTVPPNTTKGAKLGFITNMRNFMSDLYRKHMYKYSGALKLDEKLANALGVKKLPKEMSLEDRASMFETMRSGLLRDFKRMWFDPFKRAIKASGIDPQDLSMYLWARSAADRNALIAERNRDMPDGGSGLTNLEAEAILAYYKASGLMRKMEPLIKQHDQLVDWMLKQRVKNGLMSKAEADLLRKQQPFYTPLKGFAADGDMFTAGDEDPHTDYKGPSQLGVRPQDYIKTEGRASMPFDPVSNLISDAMYLTQRIARNDVGKRFVSIVRDFPDLLGDAVKIYTDDKPKIVSKGIAPPGSTKKTVGPMNMAANANKFIVVKIDGKNYYVELNEKKSDGAMLKRMFENMTPKDLDGLVKILAKLGNLKKQMLTRFNPPFWVWNFGTDVYDAIVTAISEKTREGSPVQGKDVALRFMGNLVKPSTWAAVGRYITGRDPTDAKAAENVLLLSQMVQDGGEAGRQYVMKAEEVADEIKRDAAIIKSGGVKNIWGKANEKRRALVRVVDGINEFLGLVPRFAAYKAAIDAGVEADDAAKFALDSTLNLSRKGEATDAVDNIYLFTNPAAQSLEKKGRIYKSKYGRRALAGMMTLGVGLHFFNMMMAGDEDDDGENDYQELDEATKLKNLIIYTGDGEPIKLPVGFLVAFEVYLGQQLARMITNDSSGIGVMQAAANAWNGFFSSQLPAGDKIGSFGDIPKLAIPDVFTFGLDLYRNKNYFDGQIYPEPYYEGQAVSGMPRESTGEFYKKFAAAVNRWGGGTEDVASDFDTPAEAWQYAVNQNLLVGGAGMPRDFFKAYEEADVTKLPIVKRFVGDSSEYAAQNKYFDRIQKIEVIAGQKEGENKDTDAYAESKEKFPVEADSKVIKAYKDSEKQLRKLNKDARDARKNGGPNMQSKLDKIKQDRNEVYVKFNRKYNEVKQGL